jgi:hypothetical protein
VDARVMSKLARGLDPREQGLRGTDRPRPFFVRAASRRPASRSSSAASAQPKHCGDVLEPMPRRLTSVSYALRTARGIRPGVSSPGGRELGPLRLVRYPAGSCRGLPFVSGPSCPPAPQAPRPKSREADGLQLASSWTRDGRSVRRSRGPGITKRRALALGAVRRSISSEVGKFSCLCALIAVLMPRFCAIV